jgi:hypothetical protein
MQSWEWTCGKIITELLEMLERTKLDSFAVAVVTLLGQLGRYVYFWGGIHFVSHAMVLWHKPT